MTEFSKDFPPQSIGETLADMEPDMNGYSEVADMIFDDEYLALAAMRVQLYSIVHEAFPEDSIFKPL